MNLAFIEPFYGGSHRQWIDSISSRWNGEVMLFTRPAKHWKWRMHGAAHELAEEVNRCEQKMIDLFVASDMLDVATFIGRLDERHRKTPIVLYFHENQLSYPFSEKDSDITRNRDNHYAWINISSALAADELWFNSEFNRGDFISEATALLNSMPDGELRHWIDSIERKSKVLPVGVNKIEGERHFRKVPTVIWNHRWDYDKNPKAFFGALEKMDEEGFDFDLIVCGEEKPNKEVFETAKKRLNSHIIHWGYAPSRREYEQLLLQADIALVTANQEFFGVSAVEAVLAGAYPIFPKRLSFKEHLKASPECLYNSEGEMLSLLRMALNDRPRFDNQFFERYIWDNLWPEYERMLTGL